MAGTKDKNLIVSSSTALKHKMGECEICRKPFFECFFVSQESAQVSLKLDLPKTPEAFKHTICHSCNLKK